MAQEAGIGSIHLCAVESFGISNPQAFGFDSSLEFPPHNNPTAGINHTVAGLSSDFKGGIFDYRDYVVRDLNRPRPPYKEIQRSYAFLG